MVPQKLRATRHLTVLSYVVMLGIAGCGSPRSAELDSDGGASDSSGSDNGSSGGEDDRPHRDAAVPGHDAAPPAVDAAVPGHDASAPGVDARPPGVDAAPPGVDAAPPPVDAPPPPPVDAPPPSGLFPLGVSSDGTMLVTNGGQPFLLQGEAAWSLIVQLSTSDATRYLTDRHGRGINALLVNLIEHFYSDHPPSDTAGDAPFTTAGDFSTPNERYFAHADQVIDLAAGQGMAVMLFPAYLGFQVQEGWRTEMTAMGSVSGAPKCASYGRFLGQRYASRHNILWMWGGDDTPTLEPAVEACLKAIRDGIVAAEPGALTSAHWAPNSTSRSEPNFSGSIKLVGVYDYSTSLSTTCRNARTDASSPRMPTYLLETCYEGELIQGCSGDSAEARRRQFWGWLGCGAGQIYGIGGMWQFSSGWVNKLGSPASVSAQRLVTIAQQVAWNTLAPDDGLVTAGAAAGSIAARTANNRQAVIYLAPKLPAPAPPINTAPITVNLARLSGAVTATWQDPTANRSIAAGSGLTGSQVFTPPAGGNSAGNQDWVLVLTAQ
jgi:hypothetical protein